MLFAGFVIPSVAATDIRGDLEVQRLQTQGTSSVDAGLAVLLQAHNSALGDSLTAPGFQIHADSLHVETDVSEPTFHMGVAKVISPTASTASQDYSMVSMQGMDNRANHRFLLAPLDESLPALVRIASECSSQESSDQDSLTRIPRAQEIRNRPALTVGLQNALRWKDCSGTASLTVTGDFQLSLWEWDAELSAAEGSAKLESGTFQSTVTPADTRQVASRDVELYLYARGATLTLPLTKDAYALYLDGARIQAKDVTLFGTTGELASGARALTAQASTVQLQGDVRLALSGSGVREPFGVALSGSMSRVAVDGQTIALTRAPEGHAVAWWVYAMASLVVLAGVLIFHQVRPVWFYHQFTLHQMSGGVTRPKTWRERRGAGYWVLGYRQVYGGNSDHALFYANRSQRLFPRSADAKLLRAATLQLAGHSEGALHTYEDVFKTLAGKPDRSLVACQIARVLVDLNRLEDAVAWLKQAAAEDVVVFETEIQARTFDRLMNDPWFDGAREGHVRYELRHPAKDWSGLPV